MNAIILYCLGGCLIFSRWRLHRRILHQPFRPAAILDYHDKIRRGTHKMLFSFLQDPTNYTSHVQMSVTIVHTDLVLKLIFIRFPPSFVMSIVYGYEPKGKDDHLVHIMRKYLDLASAGLGPATTAVIETFPFRMFTHAVSYDLWSWILRPFSLTATCLVPWCYIQASIDRVSQGWPRCEGDPLPLCQRGDSESHHLLNRDNRLTRDHK